jgi:hypothetical protein
VLSGLAGVAQSIGRCGRAGDPRLIRGERVSVPPSAMCFFPPGIVGPSALASTTESAPRGPCKCVDAGNQEE